MQLTEVRIIVSRHEIETLYDVWFISLYLQAGTPYTEFIHWGAGDLQLVWRLFNGRPFGSNWLE